MTINYVSLVCDLTDGSGNPVDAGMITFTPDAVLTDATDHVVITQAPVTVSLAGNPAPVVQLAATDNVSLSPSGWSWLAQLQFPGAPPRRQFLLPFTGGATQYLSDVFGA